MFWGIHCVFAFLFGFVLFFLAIPNKLLLKVIVWGYKWKIYVELWESYQSLHLKKWANPRAGKLYLKKKAWDSLSSRCGPLILEETAYWVHDKRKGNRH